MATGVILSLPHFMRGNGEIILFIDELHTIVGAGKTDGAMDAGNMLKPMLARGQIRLIGATTLNEYRKYIEKDPALERRFQPVMADEPTIEEILEPIMEEVDEELEESDEETKAVVEELINGVPVESYIYEDIKKESRVVSTTMW